MKRDPGALTRLASARAKQRKLFAHLERLGDDAFGSIAMSHPSHSLNRLSGQVLTIPAEGRAIQMEASNDAADRVWLLHRRDGDQLELVHEATRKVLDVDTAGRFAQARSRNQGTNQRWLLEPAEDSWMRTCSVADQEVLDAKGYSTEAGTHVITYPAKLRGNQNPAYDGFENQLWVLREVQ